jgi:hypothetical protein
MNQQCSCTGFEVLAIVSVPFSDKAAETDAPVAQLDRAFGYEPKGRTFESCRAHYEGQTPTGTDEVPVGVSGLLHGPLLVQLNPARNVDRYARSSEPPRTC